MHEDYQARRVYFFHNKGYELEKSDFRVNFVDQRRGRDQQFYNNRTFKIFIPKFVMNLET